MSEDQREMPRRRRRPEAAEEQRYNPEEASFAPERERSLPPEQAEETAAGPASEREIPAAPGADSRIPPEARRMNASPYGEVKTPGLRRPGTRPAQGYRRSPEGWPEAQKNNDYSGNKDRTRQVPASRIRVGYAPGRMSEGTESAAEPRNIPRNPQQELRPARVYPERQPAPRPAAEAPAEKGKKHPVLWSVTVLAILCAAALIAVMLLPKETPLRKTAEELAQKIAAPLDQAVQSRFREAPRIESFTVTGNENAVAPAKIIFGITAEKSVKEVRLTDEAGQPLSVKEDPMDNAENNIWTLTLEVLGRYEGTVTLEVRREGEEWQKTTHSVALKVAGPDTEEETGLPTAAPADPQAEETPEDGEPESAENPGDLPESEMNAGEEEAGPEYGEEDGSGTEPEYGEEPEADEEEGEAEGAETDEEAEAETPTPMPTVTPTPSPSPTPEPTATPPLTAEAVPGANPELITQTLVYSGSKKEKDYRRAAKELIHMPSGWDYYTRRMGVFTFRGNAFRTNSAVGHTVSASGLKVLWTTEAGSARGATQTYYGYEWTGQPAIVRWSTQVREKSNIDVDKQKKAPLYEVIIAGVDGVIRFLDLEDGTMTRPAINLGYPMKGTPSVHPAGYPYMTVGQYARKMKVKTGKIGLRQYNLYTQKELNLIDGLDGKLHRALNDTGSFETSALIDWTSDTLITAGTNGLLYLTSLNPTFDYNMGVLKTNPSTVVMASRAKGQKNKALLAVESSPAMYDRYVFYADMGGVLRCVDTDFLSTVWAVETGDAVMAAVALDFHREDALDLYTANMLANRRKGNAQIRKYDAMSGKELWTVEIGVQKDTKKKTKEDVGVKASPVIGENGLKDLVYFTVTGLNDEGRQMLRAGDEAKAAIVALEKETGKIRWARGLSDRSESSPMAVYDDEGNGWIIQCAQDGTILLLDGLTGDVVSELQVEGTILGSPAAYNNLMVIGTTGKGTEFIYGINIH